MIIARRSRLCFIRIEEYSVTPVTGSGQARQFRNCTAITATLITPS